MGHADSKAVPLDRPIGRRVGVFGGGGKTTLSAAIARKLGLNHIELDEIHHQANWTPRPRSEIWQVASQRMDASPEGWVVDGNYSDIRANVLARADTAIVIQLPFSIMFWRVFRRTVSRSLRREQLWNGNRESWRTSFASRDSVLLEVWRKRHRYRRYLSQIASELPEHVALYPITSARQLDEFYRVQGLHRS